MLEPVHRLAVVSRPVAHLCRRPPAACAMQEEDGPIQPIAEGADVLSPPPMAVVSVPKEAVGPLKSEPTPAEAFALPARRSSQTAPRSSSSSGNPAAQPTPAPAKPAPASRPARVVQETLIPRKAAPIASASDPDAGRSTPAEPAEPSERRSQQPLLQAPTRTANGGKGLFAVAGATSLAGEEPYDAPVTARDEGEENAEEVEEAAAGSQRRLQLPAFENPPVQAPTEKVRHLTRPIAFSLSPPPQPSNVSSSSPNALPPCSCGGGRR